MAVTFEIYEIEVDPRSASDDEFGGDMNKIGTRKGKTAAISFAIKQSHKSLTTTGKKLHETMVEELDSDGDIAEQWIYKKGKCVHNTRPS